MLGEGVRLSHRKPQTLPTVACHPDPRAGAWGSHVPQEQGCLQKRIF